MLLLKSTEKEDRTTESQMRFENGLQQRVGLNRVAYYLLVVVFYSLVTFI